MAQPPENFVKLDQTRLEEEIMAIFAIIPEVVPDLPMAGILARLSQRGYLPESPRAFYAALTKLEDDGRIQGQIDVLVRNSALICYQLVR